MSVPRPCVHKKKKSVQLMFSQTEYPDFISFFLICSMEQSLLLLHSYLVMQKSSKSKRCCTEL